MTPSLYIDTEREALLSIQRIASSLALDLSAYERPSVPPETSEALKIPELEISFPPNILSPLNSLKVPEEIRQEILQRFYKLADDLRHTYTSSYKKCLARTRTQDFEIDPTVLRRVFQARFEKRCFPMVQSHVSSVLQEIEKYQSPVSDVKPSFNSEYTPVLERYFQFNGYPSVVHRSSLANHSGMTARQIEVWFQNHRNRAKKEGRSIPRLNSEYPLKQSLALLQQDVFPSHIRPPTPPVDIRISPKPVPLPTQTCSTSILDCSSRPPHAFPATKSSVYPDPFPNDNGKFELPSLIWRRKPATVPIASLSIDMDEFVQTFHLKLNFSENSRRRAITPPRCDSSPSEPWFAATITLPSSAPHPALVRTFSYPKLISPTPFPLSEMPISTPIFGSSSLSASSALPILPTVVPGRKIISLPRRTPSKLQHNTFSRRTSSFSSDISSGSRASSSPELLTPPPLPNLDLPIFHDTQQDDLFDFSRTELDTNYALSYFPPTQDSNSSTTYSASNKFVDSPFFLNSYFGHNLGEFFP